MPVAAETYDGVLNDINGIHVEAAHVFDAIDGATAGAIEEGSVGGGTGMNCFGFKAGSGMHHQFGIVEQDVVLVVQVKAAAVHVRRADQRDLAVQGE